MFSYSYGHFTPGEKRLDHGDNLGPTADMNVLEIKKDFILRALTGIMSVCAYIFKDR
jgi:hypothetical protein